MDSSKAPLQKSPFLAGVFLISLSVLVLQIVQTRILSVITWYYLAFFAISVAMLGMTVGAVVVYVHRERFTRDRLARDLTTYSLATALSVPLSMMVQFSLFSTITPSVTTIITWTLLTTAMGVPYVFAGVVLSLALTRSPFKVAQVYGVDLVGAALGCAGVLLLLNLVDGPTAQIVTGLIVASAAYCFSVSAQGAEAQQLKARAWWRKPLTWMVALLLIAVMNADNPVGIRPILVKGRGESPSRSRFERWNSYSRVIAERPVVIRPPMWGPSSQMPSAIATQVAGLSIDGEAGTAMFHYDGTTASIDFLRYDLVNLAYNLPGIHKAAIIGVGGGRDVLSAHLFGVREIVGVELNPVFIDLHTRDPFYRQYSNITALPNLKLYVDDARSWFASTDQRFDLVQMSMIDTWAATGAGAFSLSENGLYTLEGWRAFLKTLTDDGVFTVSRWYSPADITETGRMIGLAAAALLDAGNKDPRRHIFVANGVNIATLVLSKRPFSSEQLTILANEVKGLGHQVLLAPGQPPPSPLLTAMISSPDIATLNQVASNAILDLTVPTDNRPFFFNQLRFSRIPTFVGYVMANNALGGVAFGNLLASGALLMILFIALVAVISTILVPLRGAVKNYSRPLIAAGSFYFALIGMGFMFAEISLLQLFSVYLGHPIYSLGVCLFALILATGLGSLASNYVSIGSPRRFAAWAASIVVYLFMLKQTLPGVLLQTTAHDLSARIGVSLAVMIPLGLLLGFAFPTGMRLVERLNPEPTPWFWGINGATGVLASVLAVMLSMSMGIDKTLLGSAVCYALLIVAGLRLIRLRDLSPVVAVERERT